MEEDARFRRFSRTACRIDRAPSFTHSGQWNPTDAWCMQRGQMGRSQRWQITPATWSGCR